MSKQSPAEEWKDDVRDLRMRLQVMQDERAVQRTLYRYGHCYDYDDHDGWVDCFVDDADYHVVSHDGATIVRCRGRRELATWIRRAPHTRGRWTQHLLMEPLIDVDGETATSVAYFVRTDDDHSVPYISATGRYRDTLVRCADGAWRFSTRTAELETNVSPPSVR